MIPSLPAGEGVGVAFIVKLVTIQHVNQRANRDCPHPNLPPQAGEGTVGQKTKSPHRTVPSPACGGRLGWGQSLLASQLRC